MMAEVDVALTDYALSFECGMFAWKLGRSHALARWFGGMFIALAVCSLAAGTVHGFCPASSAGERILWPAALLALALASLSAWGAGACLVVSAAGVRRIASVACLGWVAYAAAVIAGAQTFAVAIANYLGASAFLSIALATAFVRTRDRGALVAAAGMALVFVGAAMQQAHVDCPPLRLSHNGLFHVVQGAAFAMLFCGARRLTWRDACSSRDEAS